MAPRETRATGFAVDFGSFGPEVGVRSPHLWRHLGLGVELVGVVLSHELVWVLRSVAIGRISVVAESIRRW